MTVHVRLLSGSTPGNHAVIVFPHAGGSPRFYSPWCRELPVGVDLYGVTYPGRDALIGEPAPDTLVDLAWNCAAELRPIIRSLSSIVVFGHSMGSFVAFEAIRSLERSGISVTALIASGADAPHLATGQSWHRASDDDLARYVGELDGSSRDVFAVPELRRMFLPTIRADFRLVESYQAELQPQLSCPIYVMSGESDPEVTPARSAAWAAHTRAGWHARAFPGGHFYISAQTAQIVAEISGILNGCRSSAQIGSPCL
jgi:pyochelin biosynthesis protein PchC